jgi:hypothetical protein
MEMQKSCMFSANRLCHLHGDLQMFQVFHCDRGQLVSYVDNFYVRSMSMCQESVFLLVLGHEPIKEAYNQK